MRSLAYKEARHGEVAEALLFAFVGVVVFAFVFSVAAGATLYSVKTVEGTSHVLSLWNGRTCTADGCFTGKLPPGGWCGQRRSTYTAMQAISIVSLLGSLGLVSCSLFCTLATRVHWVNVCRYGSAAATWLFLLVEWSLMTAVFHSNACSNPSFNDIDYQYGPSFALIIIAWTVLTVTLIYSGMLKLCTQCR